MAQQVIIIEYSHLALSALPVAITLLILQRWTRDVRTGAYSVLRMLTQLLLIGYFLDYLFNASRAWVVIAVLAVMLLAASWISLRTVRRDPLALRNAMLALLVGSGSILGLITFGILGLDPWYRPDYLIPLAGMMFANGMNSLSLAADRYESEIARGADPQAARGVALHTAMIPVINAMFAVGLVSLPGMMTGQILSGVSPLIAVRYQVMIMCTVFGASGISTAIFLQLSVARVPSGMVPPADMRGQDD